MCKWALGEQHGSRAMEMAVQVGWGWGSQTWSHKEALPSLRGNLSPAFRIAPSSASQETGALTLNLPAPLWRWSQTRTYTFVLVFL